MGVFRSLISSFAVLILTGCGSDPDMSARECYADFKARLEEDIEYDREMTARLKRLRDELTLARSERLAYDEFHINVQSKCDAATVCDGSSVDGDFFFLRPSDDGCWCEVHEK